ncbi:MAG: fatty acid oxidation complex subunit alpha FadB, partial [Gammaproteobacteria bacterium]|nr:fatty acid oxidation complex subunit alpha FadB [Gammaproteobacteria bacterium]
MLFEGQSITCKMLDGGIAEFCFDLQQQSINKFDQPTFKEFHQLVEILQNTSELKGVLVTSTKKVFIVGADITEFISTFKESEEQIQ